MISSRRAPATVPALAVAPCVEPFAALDGRSGRVPTTIRPTGAEPAARSGAARAGERGLDDGFARAAGGLSHCMSLHTLVCVYSFLRKPAPGNLRGRGASRPPRRAGIGIRDLRALPGAAAAGVRGWQRACPGWRPASQRERCHAPREGPANAQRALAMAKETSSPAGADGRHPPGGRHLLPACRRCPVGGPGPFGGAAIPDREDLD